MAGLLALVWLAAGLCGHLRIGQCALTTTPTERSMTEQEVRAVANSPEAKEPEANQCVGEQVLDKVKALEHTLTTLQQTLQAPSPYSVAGLGSSQNLLKMKNKFLILETRLDVSEMKMKAVEAIEAKVEAAQIKLNLMETMETKLRVQEPTNAKLEAMEAKLIATETKLIETEIKMEAMETHIQAAETKLESVDLLEIRLQKAETELESVDLLETRLQKAETELEFLDLLETRLEKAETELEFVDVLETRLGKAESELEVSDTAVKELRSALERAESALQDTRSQVGKSGASTFVRWGRKTCFNSSQLLYSGVVGGSHFGHTGAAANALCLTMEPEFDSKPVPQHYTLIYGAEHQFIKGQHDQDVPCSVCRTPHPTTLMIPSTHSCPPGWTTQYTGHLVAGLHAHPAATEFVCLDGEPEAVSGGHKNDDGYLFYYVTYVCGSLHCPPYINKKLALCVVCSK